MQKTPGRLKGRDYERNECEGRRELFRVWAGSRTEKIGERERGVKRMDVKSPRLTVDGPDGLEAHFAIGIETGLTLRLV